jgi:ATP-dependent HslUV protease ATP-binding subunit HslU
MAQFAFRVNETTENIGARRLHTIMERVLDEISFVAPDLIKAPRPESGVLDIAAAAADGGAMVPLPVVDRPNGIGHDRTVVIDPEYVRQMVASIVKDQDLSRYIL